MRVAVLADVHGNLPALEAVLADVEAEGFDLVVSAGDVVSGPMPAECLERLAALGADRIRWVMGNADREALDGTDAWVHERLSSEHRALLASFAPTVDLDGEVLVCHGTPASDEECVTVLTPAERLERIVAGVTHPVVVGGHVHHQFVQRAGAVQWVNAGSVGLPYEGAPGAYWLALLQDGPDHRRSTSTSTPRSSASPPPATRWATARRCCAAPSAPRRRPGRSSRRPAARPAAPPACATRAAPAAGSAAGSTR